MTGNSPCLNIVADYNFPAGYKLEYQYTKHLGKKKRPAGRRLDLGAFELSGPGLPSGLLLLDGGAD